MRTWFKPKEKLPPPNTYVLIHVPDRPWIDDDDDTGVFFKVAKFVKGISKKERGLLSNEDERKITYYPEDEFGNNHKGYSWKEFGPGEFFGQEVKCWSFIND
jgi:hypothetical protein